MISTANKKSVNRLSLRSLKTNKLRNLFIIIAIILTTILFTSVFTIAMSMIKSIEQSTMRQVGTSAHGGFKYLTPEEFQKLKKHKLIKNFGYSIEVGIAENKELRSTPTEIRYASANEAGFMFNTPTTGKMPGSLYEIATNDNVLEKLKVPCKIGQKVRLSFRLNGKMITQVFTLSGYWRGDNAAPANMIWVSDKYINEKIKGIDTKSIKDNLKNSGNLSGLIFLNVVFSNSFNIEGKLLKILKDNGYTEADIPIGVNWAYSTTNLLSDLGSFLGLIGAVLIILLSGYLIIYNIFYISIARDTKFYGMLKTIGTTSKQIKVIVKNQARILSAIGIPIGLAAGYIVGIILVPFAMQSLNITQKVISFNSLIFIGAALFSLVTVSISCRKPAKIASRISPVEAVRYTGVRETGKRKVKESANGAKVYKMALANILRNRKKAIITITSLSLSIMLLNSVHTIVTGFDMEKYVSQMMSNDFAVADSGYFNPSIGYRGQDTLKESIINDIASRQGVKDFGRVYFDVNSLKLDNKALEWFRRNLEHSAKSQGNQSYFIEESKQSLKSGTIPLQLYGIDKLMWNKLKIISGEFNAEKFALGDYVVIGRPFFLSPDIRQSYYKAGDVIKVSYKSGKEKNYRVMAVGEIPNNLSVRYSTSCGMDFYLPSEEFKNVVKNPVAMTAVFDVSEKYIEKVESYLADYIKNKNSMLAYKSRRTLEKEFAGVKSTFGTMGYSLSFIIALIGILNFINSMVTGIISRRQEHAMLQSIGMTKKQLYKMLIFEGIYYTLFTVAVSVTLGMLIGYFIINAIAGGIWFFEFHFTIKPVMICIPILLAISVIIPIICYKIGSRMSIVERLREAE